MQDQLFSDRIGGATIDTAQIKSISLAKGVGELERDLTKGDDVEIRIVARVLGSGGKDKYNAHGNISETVKNFELRVDELSIVSVNQAAFKTEAQAAEERAKAEAEEAKAGGTLVPVPTLSVPQLLAVVEHDTTVFEDAGKYVVPEVIAELKSRAAKGDGEAVEAVEKLEDEAIEKPEPALSSV